MNNYLSRQTMRQKGVKMRNALNIYKRKDGRFEGRIPIGYDDNGKIIETGSASDTFIF